MMMIEKLSDPAAERGVLAGVCLYGKDAFVDIDDILSVNSFTIDSNQLIFKCLKYIFTNDHQSSVDLALIYGAAKSLKLGDILEQKDERAHLRAILNLEVNIDNVRKFAIKLKKLEIVRIYYTTLQESAKSLLSLTGNESIDNIIGTVESPIFNVTSTLTEEHKSIVPLGDGLLEYLDHIENNPRDIMGISSGYPIYDQAIGGGFRRKTINVIGARPKVGKTTLAANIALFVSSKLQIPTLILDTEMSQADHWHKMLANISDISIREMESGKYSKIPNKKQKMRDAANIVIQSPCNYANVAGKPFEEIISLIRRWILKTVGKDEYGNTKDCLVIFDYLKLMDSDMLTKNLQEYHVLGFQMTALHNIAVKLDIPIVTFIQLNRDGITKESTDAASGSDRIIWLCSNFSIYKHKTEEEMAEDGLINGNRKLLPVVCRHGAGLEDGDYINMHVVGSHGRIKEGRTRIDIIHNKTESGFQIDDTNESANCF